MSTVAEAEVVEQPLTAGAAGFPPSQKAANPLTRRGPLPADIVAAVTEDEAPKEEVPEPPADEPPVEEPTETPTDEASDNSDLIQEAVDRLGISQKVAESLGDEVLDLLASFDRHTSAAFRETLKTEEPEPQVKAPEPEPTKPAAEKFKLELDPDLYDEDQIKVFTSLQDKLNAQDEIIKAMAQLVVSSQRGVDQITGQTQAEAESRYESLADGFFANLGDGFKDLFGVIPMRSLATDSPLRTSRNEVVEEAHVLKAVDVQKGRKALTDEQYLQRALRTLHTDKLKSIAKKEVLNDAAQRRSQAIHRPSGHNASPMTARQRAEKHIADVLRRSGIGVEE